MFGSVCGSVFSSSISDLLGFDPTPEIHSTKCKPFTCRLTDGMSISGVSGVGLLNSWHVGHGFFETLQDLMSHFGGRHLLHVTMYRILQIEQSEKLFLVLFSSVRGDVILSEALVPNVLRGLLLGIAPRSIVLP
jgi:hypothetical protein